MQLDIAVALSQSASEADRASEDAVREEDDVERAKRLSLTPGQASSAAEALSCKLWQTEWYAAGPFTTVSKEFLVEITPTHAV